MHIPDIGRINKVPGAFLKIKPTPDWCIVRKVEQTIMHNAPPVKYFKTLKYTFGTEVQRYLLLEFHIHIQNIF